MLLGAASLLNCLSAKSCSLKRGDKLRKGWEVVQNLPEPYLGSFRAVSWLEGCLLA